MTPDELQQYAEKYLRWIDEIEKEILQKAQEVEWIGDESSIPASVNHDLAALHRSHEVLVIKLELIYEIQREMKKREDE